MPLDSFTTSPQRSDGLHSQCRLCTKGIRKKYRAKIREWEKRRDREQPEKVREYKRRYRANHPETMKAIYNRRAKKVLSTTDGHLNNIMRNTMGYSLDSNKRGIAWESLVPYTLDDLKAHIESQFQEGMNWGNHAKFGWHIDHIRPIRSFTFKAADDPAFQVCWALDNLRPLWWRDNLIKHCKEI